MDANDNNVAEPSGVPPRDGSVARKRSPRRRKSGIPIPVGSKPKVIPPPAASSFDSILDDPNSPGITTSTPSFREFVAGLSALENDELEPGEADRRVTELAGIPPLPEPPEIEDVPDGEPYSPGISAKSPSFEGFLASLEELEEGEELLGTPRPPPPSPPPPKALDLTLGEKFQAASSSEDYPSKNGKRHRKRRRLRTKNVTKIPSIQNHSCC